MGIDSREVTPELTRAVVHLAAEVRSFQRAEIATEKVLNQKVSQSTIRRLTKQVGQEFASLQQHDQRKDGKEVVVPEVAVVSCDGGRIRARQPGQGRGVCPSGENGWRETKNASFEKMTLNDKHVEDTDSCPSLPTSFRTASKVADIAEKPVPIVHQAKEGHEADQAKEGHEAVEAKEGDVAHESVEAVESVEKALDQPQQEPEVVKYEGPRRVLRTALASMASSDEFGPQMEREAKRRGFFQAPFRAFLGDGLNWNWSIWKKYFPTFIPILDFIHAIQYIFSAAMAMRSSDPEGWSTYVRWITLCWQGRVDTVIEELRTACRDRGVNLEEKVSEDDPHKPLADAIRYLSNNRARMDYPRYRRLGLPVTSAPMESLIKQMNLRVKGTEMFWDDPEGAEAILHIRAAALSEDDRLGDYLSRRTGCAFHRRTTQPAIAA